MPAPASVILATYCAAAWAHCVRKWKPPANSHEEKPRMADQSPAPGLYRHFKGNLYELVEVARHSETLEDYVVYRAMYGDHGLWEIGRASCRERVCVWGDAG